MGNICFEIYQLNSTADNVTTPWKGYYNLAINCGSLHNQIVILTQEIKEYNMEHFRDKQLRKKRGLLNIIGELSRDLFGTLSQEDANDYIEQFKKLEHNGLLRDQLIHKQTTLIQSNLNLIRDTQRLAMQSDSRLYAYITDVKSAIDILRSDIYNMQFAFVLKSQSQDLMSFVLMLLHSYQSKQRQILQALSLATRGGNSPIIIPPELFMNELIKIRNAMAGNNVDLPIPLNKDNIAHYYQLASPQSRLVDNQLIITFTIPLTSTKEYRLFKATSFPNQMPNGLFHFIIPHHEYLAIDQYRQTYIAFTNQELTSCNTVQLSPTRTILICMLLTPIQDIRADRDDCEITLLTKDSISNNCNIRITNITSQAWIKLRQLNTWIYVIPNKEMIYIGCPTLGQTGSEILLSGTGLLTIAEDCEIKTQNILIQAFKTYRHEVLMEAIPYGHLNIDIKNVISSLSHIKPHNIKQLNSPSVISFGQNDKLQEASVSLQELIQLEEEITQQYSPLALRRGINSITTMVIIIIIIILIIIARLVYKRHYKIHKKKRSSKIQPSEPEVPDEQPTFNGTYNRYPFEDTFLHIPNFHTTSLLDHQPVQ